MDYKEIKVKAEALIKEVEVDKYKQYSEAWKAEVVALLDDYNYEHDSGDVIYDLDSEEWEEVVKMNLEQRGWVGVKILLEGIDATATYARLDGYGNGRSCDYELIDLLKNLIDEIDEIDEIDQ